MSRHLASLIRNLTDAELAAKIEGFRASKDWTMLAALRAEQNRRIGG